MKAVVRRSCPHADVPVHELALVAVKRSVKLQPIQ